MQQQPNILGKVAIKKMAQELNEQYPMIGHFIFWSFSQAVIDYALFKKILADHGISEKLAPQTRRKSAIIKAMDEFMLENKTQFRRKVTDDDKVVVYVIVHSRVDSHAQDVEFKVETKVMMDKATEAVVIQSPNQPPEIQQAISDKILGLLAKYEQSYDESQIRAMILRYVYEECAGVMVRDNGGLYFIPQTRKEQFQTLHSLVKALGENGAKSSVDTVGLVDLPEARATVWKAFMGEAEAALKEMQQDIDSLATGLSSRSQQTRLDRFLDLKTKIEMYGTLLQGQGETLMNSLSKMETSFKEKFMAAVSK